MYAQYVSIAFESSESMEDYLNKTNIKDKIESNYTGYFRQNSDCMFTLTLEENIDIALLEEICNMYPDELVTFRITCNKWEESPVNGLFECDVYYNEEGNLEFGGHWAPDYNYYNRYK